MTSLVRYDAMLHAIAQCHDVDEIKQIHDQAAALEAAARVAMNTEAERQAIEIRVRAERQAGSLMKAMQRDPASKGGDQKSAARRERPKSEYAAAIERAKIPEQTARRWQELSEVPEERFEAHLAAEEMPSARAIIESAKVKPQMSEEALWLWGQLREFERMGVIDADPLPLIDEMTQTMRADVRRLAPLIASFLNRCMEKEIA